MTTLLDRIDSVPETRSAETTTPAQRLRATMAASRVRFTWFGVQKSLTPQQKSQAAEAFDADLHRVARLDRANTFRRAGVNQIARLQSEESRQVCDRFRDRPDEMRDIAFLLDFTVNGEP